MKKNEERSREMWEIIKCSKTHLLRWEYQNERTEKKQEKKIVEIYYWKLLQFDEKH